MVKELASSIGITAGQLALAWCWPRTTTSCQFLEPRAASTSEENVAAIDVVPRPAQVSILDSVFPPSAAPGERYGANMMPLLNL